MALPQTPAQRFLSQEPLEVTPQQECEKKGGKWDAATRTCIMNVRQQVEVTQQKKAQAEAAKPKTITPTAESLRTKEDPTEVYRNVETGRLGGATIPDGRTFVGLSPSDTKLLAEQQAGIQATPAGAVEASAAGEARIQQQRQIEQQQQIQQQIAQIGQLGQVSAAQQADVNLSQAATAGVAGAIPGVIGGTLGGATIGALGGPVGAVGGAVIGGVGSFVAGLLGNIKEQQRGELQAADVELSNARTNMRQLAMLASQDPANADMYIQQYNQQLTRIHQARRQTKAEVQGDLNAWMEDGREQLADFDAFLQPGGIADVYGQKLAIAMQTGVPLSINGEGLLE